MESKENSSIASSTASENTPKNTQGSESPKSASTPAPSVPKSASPPGPSLSRPAQASGPSLIKPSSQAEPVKPAQQASQTRPISAQQATPTRTTVPQAIPTKPVTASQTTTSRPAPAQVAGAQKGDGFTYDDFSAWGDDERWEIIDGVAYAISAPLQDHQSILLELAYQLYSFVKGKPYKMFVAPFDVLLAVSKAGDTVVQPDILVVCDSSKLDGKKCSGSPDLAIEITSPSTAQHDRLRKLKAYEKAGVGEYWIVENEINAVTVYTLENDRYSFEIYSDSGKIPVNTLKGCSVDAAELFSAANP